MKFFRKNTKYLLAIVMVLLLVVWLLEDTVQSWGRGSGGADVEWGEVYGQAIPLEDIYAVRQDVEILNGLGIPWHSFFMYFAGQIREPLDLQEWYMLDREAQRRGIHVPDADVAQMRESLAGEAIDSLRKRYKVSNADIDRALKAFSRVRLAFLTDLQALKVSEADIQNYLRETAEKAKVKMAILNGAQFIDPAYEPTEEEYRQQFEKYKDKDPGMGEDRFGYRKPERVQIEYIQVKAAELAKHQNVDDEEAHKYWKENKKKFTRPPETQPSTAPAVEYENYTEARAAVLKDLAMTKAKREALRLGTEMAKALSAPWATQPATQPGYRQPPADALDHERYPKIVDAFRSRAHDALAYHRTQMVDRTGFYALGSVANAIALQGTPDMISLRDAAFLVQGLAADPKDPTLQRQARWFHNLYETLSEPFVDYEGNVYVFRTIAVEPKQPPASMAEVKDRLRADLRAQRGAQEAAKLAEQLLERAKQVGLEEAVKQMPELAQKLSTTPVVTPEPFARHQAQFGRSVPTRVQEIGFDPKGEFVETVFSMAGKTTTQPTKVALYPLESQQRYVVVELVDILPVTQAEYEAERERAEQMLSFGNRSQFAMNWFSPENIRARVGWKPAHPELDEQKTEKAGV